MHVVIIGNGIAGVTTARHLRKQSSDCKITLISAETEHFFSRTALMYIYMGHMKYAHTKPYEDYFWEKNRIGLLFKQVDRIVPETHSITFSTGETLTYDKLVLATGSRPNKFGWPGQDLDGVQGLYSYQDLESLEKWSEDLSQAVIVGGGLIGIELAEMFHSRHIPVTFLVREDSFWNKVMPAEESAMINREILANGIDLRLETEMKEILPDAQGRARAVVTGGGEEVSCQFVGLTAGVHPRIELAEGTEIETGRGFLIDAFLQTNVADIYAIGDCAELRDPISGRRGIEAVWYTGKLMGPILAQNILGKPTPYRQQTWFNSAKFMDIEWQTYGTIEANPAAGTAHFYWEHPDGRKSVRIAYNEATGAVTGFNTMGIRYRQEVCIRWIDTQTPIEEVLPQLALANFDPEFFKTYEKDILHHYNTLHGTQLQSKRKKRLADVLQFLK